MGSNLNRWTKIEDDFLKENFNKLSRDEISKILNRSKSSISSRASKLGLKNIKNRKINLFEVINSEESAYWLGFIYADGYILVNTKDRNHCNYELGIELQKDDIEHLEKFNSIFNNYYKIKTRTRSMNSLDALNGKDASNRLNETCLMRMYSKKIVKDLINQNVLPNKTNKDEFPKIDNNEMFLHFLRGYIDGDGSYIMDRNGKRLSISIEGNNSYCFDYIIDRLKNDFGIKASYYKDKECWKLQIRIKEDVIKLIDLMFENANIYLDRKYEKIIEMKKAVCNRNITNN